MLLCGAREQPARMLKQSELAEHVGERNVLPHIKAAVERLFNVKVKAVNTYVRKGKKKTFKNIRALLSDSKRAIVTLEEGHSIDVTTGL